MPNRFGQSIVCRRAPYSTCPVLSTSRCHISSLYPSKYLIQRAFRFTAVTAHRPTDFHPIGWKSLNLDHSTTLSIHTSSSLCHEVVSVDRQSRAQLPSRNNIPYVTSYVSSRVQSSPVESVLSMIFLFLPRPKTISLSFPLFLLTRRDDVSDSWKWIDSPAVCIPACNPRTSSRMRLVNVSLARAATGWTTDRAKS